MMHSDYTQGEHNDAYVVCEKHILYMHICNVYAYMYCICIYVPHDAQDYTQGQHNDARAHVLHYYPLGDVLLRHVVGHGRNLQGCIPNLFCA